jgi:hypothetical protein
VHTLAEPRFLATLVAYHRRRPLSQNDVAFIVESYRFFILHYVLSMGDHFFRSDLYDGFRMDAVEAGLPEIDQFDITPLIRAVSAV